MKKRHELARALTELPDELLLEAAQTERRRKPMKLHRIAAVAAIIAMLAVTVGAAAVGITWTVGKETGEDLAQKYGGLALDYYKDYDGSQSFEKLEFSVPLEVVELPEQNMALLKAFLCRYWELTQQADYAQSHDTKPEQEFIYDSMDVDHYLEAYISRYGILLHPWSSFETLSDTELLLGTILDVPEAIREAIRQESEAGYDKVVTVRILTGATVAQAAEAKGDLEPTKVIVSFDLNQHATNGRVTGSITIPLTEKAAQEGLQGLHYSYEKEGAIWQEEQTVDGRTVTLFGNDPEAGYDGWSGAVYTQDGMGYCIHARRDADIPFYSPSWPYYDSAKEMVLSLLEDSE